MTEIGGWDPIGEDHHPFVIVKTYLADGEPSTAATQRQIEEGLWFLGRVYPLGEPQVRPLKEEDWANVWKASYKPLKVGRFLIIPTWEKDTVQPAAGDFPVILDPGMAFGTGLHPSTQLCMIAMDGVVDAGTRCWTQGAGPASLVLRQPASARHRSTALTSIRSHRGRQPRTLR